MIRKPGRKVPRFAVGSAVRIRFGVDLWDATIVEDRGDIGRAGEQLYRFRLKPDDPDFDLEFELPRSAIASSAEEPSPHKAPARSR